MLPAAELLSRLSRRLQSRPRPRDSEVLALPGLEAPGEVRFDEAGVPHIRARSDADLFLLQGFVTARERAFQMDFNRRAVSGRLAEILGRRPMSWKDLTIQLKDKTVVDADRLLRTLGLRKAAELSLPRLSEDTRLALERYATGVSLAFDRGGPGLALEMRLLRYQPERWVPADSVSLIKGMAFELSMAWRTVLLLDAISFRLADDPERMKLLIPKWPKDARPPARWNGLRAHSADELALEETFRAFTAHGGAHIGSNAWAVSGDRSRSGKPLLAGDPHLLMTAPSTHFMVQLESPGYRVAGSSIPGVPGVIMGHNESVAWSMTAALVHDADIFVEELDAHRTCYRAGETWHPLEVESHAVRVRGERQPERFQVLSTRHGPLVHDVTYPFHDRPGGLAHALQWTGQAPSTDLDGLLAINRARSWPEFRDATRLLHAPALNFVYADTSGHIGWQLAGAVPVRKDGSDGLRPADGASGGSDWERLLDLDELPHLFDPPDGIIVSANTKPVGDEYPHPLGHNFEPPFRYDRIRSLLEAGGPGRRLGLHDMARIQRDQRSGWAERIVKALYRPVLESRPFSDPDTEAARRLLLAWDFEAQANQAAPAVFYTAMDIFMHEALCSLLGEELTHGYLEILNLAALPFENLVASEDAALLLGVDRERLVVRSLEEAARSLRKRQGDPERWRWGALHQLWHRHRLHVVPALRPLFSVGPFETGGDGFSVNNAHFHHAHPFEMIVGPGLRHLHDLSDWSASLFITNTGNSGVVTSAGYRSYAARWARGEYLPLHFGSGPGVAIRVEAFEPA